MEDDEPFTLDPLGRYRLLEDSFAPGWNDEVLRARGVYPWARRGPRRGPGHHPGLAGPSRGLLAATRPRSPSISRYRQAVFSGPACAGPMGSCGRSALVLSALRIVWGCGYRCCCMRPLGGAPWGAAGAGKAVVVIPGVARDRAGDLLGLLQLGLREPLPLFPEASCTWAEAVRGGKAGDEKFAALESQWRPERSRGRPPEGLTLAARHAFPQGLYPFRDRFCALAEHVFLPLLEAGEVSPGGGAGTLRPGGRPMTRFDPHACPWRGGSF